MRQTYAAAASRQLQGPQNRFQKELQSCFRSRSSDTSWTVGNSGMPISTSPIAAYAPSLEGTETGLFIDTNGAALTSPVSGQLNFWWGDNFIAQSQIYRGVGNVAQFFTF